MREKNNDEIVLDYLINGGVITTRIAPNKLGIADVRANIRNLRNAGYNIKDRWIIATNRRGNKTRFKEYFLEGKNGTV